MTELAGSADHDTAPPDRSGVFRRAVLGTSAAALATTVGWLLAPPMGIDLAAQVARGDFWARNGAAVLDFGWYGGLSPYSYSLITPPLMSLSGGGVDGARRVGAVFAVLASVLFVLLLCRTGARRPLIGGLLGTVGIVGNLISGRITFTAGLAFGLATLLALTSRRAWLKRVGGVVGGVLTGAASPVAGLFLALAAVALLVTTKTSGRRWEALLVAAAAGSSIMSMSVLFGVNGPMNSIPGDTLRSATVSLAVALLVNRPAVRVGALLSCAGVLAAAALTTPVGLNAGRLSATFALGVLGAYATVPDRIRLPRRLAVPLSRRLPAPVQRAAGLVALLAVVALWQHPFAVKELSQAGNPMASAARFRPLLAEMARFGPVGRVEVVPTDAFWEAARVVDTVPLARGWLRQADTDRNPIFFDGRLSNATYYGWLQANGVSLVALADGPTAPAGAAEARLVRRAPAYLHRVWGGDGWSLYQVADSPSVVVGATLLSSTDDGIDLAVAHAGDVLVRVRWSRWLVARGPAGCLAPTADSWTTLRVRTPGTYVISGSLEPGPFC